MAWCPWQPTVLASGGGTADRHIRFWNCNSGTCMNAVDTKSQVNVQVMKKWKALCFHSVRETGGRQIILFPPKNLLTPLPRALRKFIGRQTSLRF